MKKRRDKKPTVPRPLIRARGFPVAGERLRAMRQARHWSQRTAAERAGLSEIERA